MQKATKISGLVITYNEEKNIAAIIENLNFVDELIILDSFSSDKTKEIATSFSNVTFIQNKFEDFTKQRNLALSKSKYSWILFLDADERIPEDLKNEILNEVKKPKTASAYYFYRKFMFKDKPLHYSGWQTDKNIKLFKKEKAIYRIDRLVHEKLIIEGSEEKLKNKLIHFSYTDYESYKQKMINYGNLKAKELFLKNFKPNLVHFYVKPVYKFLYSYLIRFGIFDGKRGIIICYLNAMSVFVTYQKIKLLYKE